MAARELNLQLPTHKFKGLVVNPTTLSRDFNSAPICSNVERLSDGRLSIRKGVQTNFIRRQANSYELFFPFTYSYHDTDDGALKEELLVLSMAMDASYIAQTPKLFKVVERTLTITYSGTTSGRFHFYPFFQDPTSNYVSQFKLDLYHNNNLVTPVYSTAVGNPFDTTTSVASITTLQGIVSNIDALASFACSPTTIETDADISHPCGVFGSFKDETLTNGEVLTFTYFDLEEIGDGVSAPLSITDANFTLPCAMNYTNVLYFGYGNYEMKYDGQNFYLSGLAQAVLDLIADHSSGSTFGIGETYIYKIVYSRVDIKGNVIESTDSDDTLPNATHTMAANRDMRVDFYSVNEMLANATGLIATSGILNTRGAQVNGLQAAVSTVTVDAGHTLEIGDIIYFYDDDDNVYTTRLVSATTATTITFTDIDGSTNAAGFVDNSYISNNVRIQIWRTKNAGTDFYLVDEIPNWFDGFIMSYVDSKADTLLVEPYVEQIRKNDFPPKTSFLTEHQGLKVSSGDPDNPNRVTWTLPDSPEGYPLASNLTDIKGGGLGAVTGIGTVDDDTLAVFKLTGHVLIDGSLDELNFRVLNRSNTGIGCTSFRTLSNIGDDNSLVGLALNGVFVFQNRSPKLVLSDNIRPLFDNVQAPQVNGTSITGVALSTQMTNPNSTTAGLSVRRAVAINDSRLKKYHLYIPSEIGIPGQQKYPLFPSSKYLVFDYEDELPYWTERSFINRYLHPVAGESADIQQYGSQNYSPYGGFCLYENTVWFATYSTRTTSSMDSGKTTLAKFKDNGDIYDYSDDCYPVYLSLYYNPFTREPEEASSFFKPLYILIYNLLSSAVQDPYLDLSLMSVDFGEDYIINVRGVVDGKQFPGNSPSTKVQRTFQVSVGQTLIRIKCATTKARLFQIQLTDEGKECFGVPFFENVEFIYSTPYDKKSKEVKNSG